MAGCIRNITEDGFDRVRLRNGCMSLSVLPQLGGKIAELTDLRSGREWLWKNPHLPLRHPQPGLDYDRELDSGGWDEVLFSVKPCSIELDDGQAVSIGDHGVAVSEPWDVIASGDQFIEMRVTGRTPAFELHRKITLDRQLPHVRFDYTLSNPGQVAWPWLWCAHPLIAIERGMTIQLPDGQAMRREGDRGESAGGSTWPELRMDDGARVDLSSVFDHDCEAGQQSVGMHAKVYVQSAEGVSIHSARGESSFRFEYDAEQMPWLGLWINRRGWSGCGSEPYLNLGLEPATAPCDYLTDAITDGSAKILGPGETTRWSLAVSLGTKGG